MLSNKPTNKQIEDAFDSFVENPSDGVPSDCGFDSKTEAALLAVYMDPNPLSIAQARKELRLQLDGTHARQDDAEIEEMLKAKLQRKRRK